jgi:hypothetical protein
MRQHVPLEGDAVVADTVLVEDDAAVGGVHDAI